MNRLIHYLLHESSAEAADEVSKFFVAPLLEFHRRLLAEGHEVVGLDAVTPYYDVRLKEARLHELNASPRFFELRGRLEDDAVVTAKGCELITRDVPVKVAEIEALMKA